MATRVTLRPLLLGLLLLPGCNRADSTKEKSGLETADPAVEDGDGDGWTTADDCDDGDPEVHPEAEERCDDVDNDCDGDIDEGFEKATRHPDNDGDGYGDAATAQEVCLDADGWVTDGTDCDDDDEDNFPGSVEACDSEDNDCDGRIDEDLPLYELYLDEDRDGYGDPDVATVRCEADTWWILDASDCLDSDAASNPGASEDCTDGWDRDCDGLVDCEDDDCETAAVCAELACADGRDDDDDGYTDCADDECWGDSACPTIVASRVLRGGGGAISTSSFHRHEIDTCDSPTFRESSDRWRDVHQVWDVEGTVRVYERSGSAALVCDWGLDFARVANTTVSRRWSRSATDHWSTTFSARTGFWVSGDCGLTSSGFLPPLSRLATRWTSWYQGFEGGSREFHDDDGTTTACHEFANHGWDSWQYAYELGLGPRYVVTSASHAAP